MSKEMVKARCNLFGVLRNMEYLVENDEESKNAVEGKKVSIQFNVKSGPCANLSFSDGKAEMKVGKHPADIVLFFKSADHFNKMMDGKANPIPLKGLTKIGFLTGPFMLLADRLAVYLRAADEDLKNSDFFKSATEMTAYAAMFSLPEIANHDPEGKKNACHIPDGTIQIAITGGIGIRIAAEKGILTAKKGYDTDPRCVMEFSSLQSAHGILSGKLDTYTAIALGDLEMRGYVPMIEYLNPILDQVAEYLV